jgi:hypothetical protein
MCHLDESWHVPCRHWGPRRNVSPCANGQVDQKVRIKGCLHSTTEGCSRVYALCPSCEYLGKREEKPPPSDTSPYCEQSQKSKHSQKTQSSQRSYSIQKSPRPEQMRNPQPGMTIHGLSGKDGRNWLRHRLRRWRERELTPGEKFEEKNRSQANIERKMGQEASGQIS